MEIFQLSKNKSLEGEKRENREQNTFWKARKSKRKKLVAEGDCCPDIR